MNQIRVYALRDLLIVFSHFAHILQKLKVEICASGACVLKTSVLLQKLPRLSKNRRAPGAVHPSKVGSAYCLA
jgi:hypothetical protein